MESDDARDQAEEHRSGDDEAPAVRGRQMAGNTTKQGQEGLMGPSRTGGQANGDTRVVGADPKKLRPPYPFDLADRRRGMEPQGQAQKTASALRMMCTVTTEIAAPAEAIWALLTNAADFPRWNSTVTSITGEISPGK